MATNFFKIAYDKIISIIKADQGRFTKKNRIFIRDSFRKTDFGHEDIIKIYPLTDTLIEERSVSGNSIARTDSYNIELVYFKNFRKADTDFDNLVQFGEDLIELFSGSNRNLAGFWHYIQIDSIVYDQSIVVDLLPEDMVDDNGQSKWKGFIMNIIVHRAKYAS